MKEFIQHLLGQPPSAIRQDLLDDHSADMQRRRAIVGTSLVGMASMAIVSLLQSGIVRHIPDPPLPNFDSDRVNTSETAYQFGVPDGAVSTASFALNLPLAALGGARRTSERPWISIIITAKAAAEAVLAGWYFYQMPTREKAWCGYCIVGAAASFAVLGLTLPEALKALRTLRGWQPGR